MGFKLDYESLVAGLTLAFAVTPLSPTEPEPIAYSYNGVVLPGLPEWDREKYPYAVIVRYYDGETRLYCIPNSWYLKEVSATVGIFFAAGDTFLKYVLTGEQWGECEIRTANEYSNISANDVVWSNFDIIYNGSTDYSTVELYASEPIPVYE